MSSKTLILLTSIFAIGCGESGSIAIQLSFFATSTGSGEDGGDLGGLEGADAKCQSLATAAGAGNRTWRAYLSTSSVDARDRIGNGPWFNAELTLIAENVTELHENGLEPRAPIDDDEADTVVLDENGDRIPGEEHDILTGSNPDGTLFEGRACQDWTSSSGDDLAQAGHTDIPEAPLPESWNSAHQSGCDPATIELLLGGGRIYCFAQ